MFLKRITKFRPAVFKYIFKMEKNKKQGLSFSIRARKEHLLNFQVLHLCFKLGVTGASLLLCRVARYRAGNN